MSETWKTLRAWQSWSSGGWNPASPPSPLHHSYGLWFLLPRGARGVRKTCGRGVGWQAVVVALAETPRSLVEWLGISGQVAALPSRWPDAWDLLRLAWPHSQAWNPSVAVGRETFTFPHGIFPSHMHFSSEPLFRVAPVPTSLSNIMYKKIEGSIVGQVLFPIL